MLLGDTMNIYKINFEKRIKRLSKKKEVSYNNKTTKFREENVRIAIDYLRHKEEYSQNVNGYTEDAQKRYYKTLDKKFTYIQNVLVWFNKWPLKELTDENIKAVYDKLQKNELTSLRGTFLSENSKKDYYSKVFKNGFFAYINKHDIARKIILRKFKTNKEVRFFEIETLKQISNSLRYNDHKLLVWLLFDTGLEINAALNLIKKDFSIEKSESGDNYFMLHVRDEISKKGRSTRNIFIFHNETNILLKEIIQNIGDNDKLFNFGYRNAYKIISETSKELNLKLKTHNEHIVPKDFRSSMATYFLKEGWTTDEIKARLGHNVSSSVINSYVSYLGLDQKLNLKKKEEKDLTNFKEKYEKIAAQNRKSNEELKKVKNDLELLKELIYKNREILNI